MDFSSANILNALTPAPTAPAAQSAEAAPETGADFGALLAAVGAPDVEASGPDLAPGHESLTESLAQLVPNSIQTPAANLSPTALASNAVPTDDHAPAWRAFLTKMNDELGVKPRDVLEAFQKLSDEDLARKPEDTTDQMVAALGLTGQPAALAKQYFKELIARTDAPATAAAPAPERRELGRALERMNAQLIMNAPAARAPSVPGAGAALLPKEIADDEVSPKTEVSPKREAAAPKAIDALVAKMQPVASPAPAESVPPVATSSATPVPTPTPAPAIAVPPEMVPLAKPALNTEAEAAEVAPREFAMKDAGALSADRILANARRTKDEAPDSDKDSDDFDGDLTAGFEKTAAPQGTASKTAFANELKTPDGPHAGPALAPEVVDQARVMVRGGGGEMSVKLNTELGEVAMKVNVHGGKVSVQLVAESDETKRLLEHQLGDLKAQLISHNLQVDTLQVDVGSNLTKQNQDHGQQDAQRQAQRQGWEQFNQNQSQNGSHQRQRHSSFEATARAYGQPIGRPLPPPAAAAARGANDRRLNLVA